MRRPAGPLVPVAATQDEWRDQLPWLEGALLCAIRTWVSGRRRGTAVDAHIGYLFQVLDTPSGQDFLNGLMRALNRGCTRMIEVRCLCDARLSADEMTLLDVVALEQDQRDQSATSLLAGFVNPTAAHVAAGYALGLAQSLAETGHRLTRAAAAPDRLVPLSLGSAGGLRLSTRLN